MLHKKHRWVIPHFSDSEGRRLALLLEEARETPWRMKQITAAQPSSAVSLCGDCTGNPAGIKWMQAYIQTNPNTHTHTHTHAKPAPDEPISPLLFLTEEDNFQTHTHSCYCTHTYCTVHSPSFLFFTAQTCMNALRGFHWPSSYFIHSF